MKSKKEIRAIKFKNRAERNIDKLHKKMNQKCPVKKRGIQCRKLKGHIGDHCFT